MAEKVAVVGAGIVGLAHAWVEARRGAKVTLFERHPSAQGASIRHFGMIWPIGQPNGPLHRIALRSRELWSEIIEDAGLWSDPCGSLHIASQPDELEVIREFDDLAPTIGYTCQLLGPKQVHELCPAAKKGVALGGLASPTELCINPQEAIAKLSRWLRDRWGVELNFGSCVGLIDLPNVYTTDGRVWHFDRVTVASGVDGAFLYPDLFRRSEIGRCKLQMMRTAPQSNGWRLNTLVASGLTLRHYAAFRICSSLKQLRDRVSREHPELDRYGIHVMASQDGSGSVILGDSHEYGDEIGPFDKETIDQLILRELQRFLDLPDWSIAERWHGIYASMPGEVEFVRQPSPGVTLVISTGGAGMTMSFGLAEDLIQRRQQNGESFRLDAIASVAG